MNPRQRLLALAFLGCTSCSDGIPGGALQREAVQLIISGETSADSAVFFVEVTTPSGVATCSATLIAPNVLLTAGHCVTGQFGRVDCTTTRLAEALPPENFRVTNEPDLAGSPEPTWTFPPLSEVVVVHPDALLCGNDVALLRLKESLTREFAAPVAVPQDPPLTNSYRAVGYGAVHPSGTGERRRRTSGDLEVQCRGPAECEGVELLGAAGAGPLDAPPVLVGEWIGAPSGCPGDSGGPALIETEEGRALVGVLSRGGADCSLNIYTFPQSEDLRQAVRDMIAVDTSNPIYEIPSWFLEPEEPDETPSEPGFGGFGGAALSPPGSGGTIEEQEPISSPSAYGSFGNDDARCSCRAAGSAGQNNATSPLMLVLLSFSMLGARRRPTHARAERSR